MKLYYPSENYQVDFDAVFQCIEKWPEDVQMIMKPLLTELKKYTGAETFHSLLKFVFYFDAVIRKKLEKLEPDYILPGNQGGASCT